MAALTFVVLAHRKPHARGERVSAGPGVEYIVGPDGLLYGTGAIRSGGRVRYSQAPNPGVHPDHVAALTKSVNIRRVEGYVGPVASGSAVAPTPSAPPENVVSRSEHAKVAAERDALRKERDDLKAQLAAVVDKAQLATKPPPPAPPPANPPSDNPPADLPTGAVDLVGILNVGVGKLGADIAAGKHDAVLADLRAAEAAGKNRSSALAVIDARVKALQS